jgi:hypothetical protein
MPGPRQTTALGQRIRIVRTGLRRTTLACAVLAFIVATDVTATAEVPDKDGPPPPGALLRELSGGPAADASSGSAGDMLGMPAALTAPVEIPFLIEGGHMMIEASINGGARQTFLFDTGGRILLTPDAARGLNSTQERQAMVGGVGPMSARPRSSGSTVWRSATSRSTSS